MKENNQTSGRKYKRLLGKAEQMCVSRERCLKDIETKLDQWDTPANWIDKISESLLKNNFINEERYCRAFVKDKFTINKWGKIKIKIALKQKGISETDIEKGFLEIDNEAYNTLVDKLLQEKWRTLKGKNFEKKAKAVRFLQSRGFENEIIFDAIDKITRNETD